MCDTFHAAYNAVVIDYFLKTALSARKGVIVKYSSRIWKCHDEKEVDIRSKVMESLKWNLHKGSIVKSIQCYRYMHIYECQTYEYVHTFQFD